MGSTNILLWDPNLSNAESDAAYVADSQRSGGALTDAILPSPLANKAWYQFSAMASGLATALANKGYVVNDAPFVDLVAVLSNIVTDADLVSSLVNVSYATSVNFNAATSTGFYLSLTGNVSTATLTNTSSGQLLIFIIAQDATGGRTFPWPSQLNTTAICPQPNSTSVQMFKVLTNGTTIVPVTPLIWLTSSGLVVQPGAVVNAITTSGNVPNGFGYLTEQVDVSSGNVTRYLYSAIGTGGFIVNGKNLPGSPAALLNTLTYVPIVGGQTIDGFPNYQVNPYDSISFQSNGANGFIII